jgi:hypothetical protein
MKADLINELARLRDELRNVSTKIDNALNGITEEQNAVKPMPSTLAGPTVVPNSFVNLDEGEESFLRNWMDSNAKPSFTDWERSFLDSVLQRNMQSPVMKLTQRQYDSFVKIYAKHEAAN